MRHVLRLTVFSLALGGLPASAQTAAPVELRILAINDFHGNLRPPPGGIRISDPEDKSRKVMVAAGGAEYMATLVKQLREGHKNTIFVAAGDLIGASPFLSAMFHDEPTIEALSMMGLDIASVGNHEFDEGEADTVNALVPELKARGVEAIVVLIHEGGQPTGDYNECPGISGPIVDIVKKFERADDVVLSGHTHQAYVGKIDGRLDTSGDKYGALVTAIDVKLDPV